MTENIISCHVGLVLPLHLQIILNNGSFQMVIFFKIYRVIEQLSILLQSIKTVFSFLEVFSFLFFSFFPLIFLDFWKTNLSKADNGSIRFWDWKSGYCFQEGETIVQPGSLDSEMGIFASTFDKSGSRLITCEADKTVKMWKEDENAVIFFFFSSLFLFIIILLFI